MMMVELPRFGHRAKISFAGIVIGGDDTIEDEPGP
jgi:hypothetical protein